MSRNISELPFTEIVERLAQIARNDKDNDLSRIRGAVNDVYIRELPKREDWQPLLADSAITTDLEYKTGTATVNTGATAVTFSSDTVLTAGMTGRKIKFGTNPDIYTLTFTNATGGTINPPLSGITNLSSSPFSVYQDVYALAPSFDRFLINGGLFYFQGGRITVVEEAKSEQEFFKEFNPSPSKPKKCRLVESGTDGVPHVQVTPPASGAMILGYRMIRKLTPMRETSAGFVDISAGGTVVTGSVGTTRFTEASTGDYFRISAFGKADDSRWYRITAIANDSSLTLSSAFGLSGATTAGYVISQAPELPAKMHFNLITGGAKFLLADQNDKLFQYWDLKDREETSANRKLYKTRVYSPQIDSQAEDFLYRY